MLYCSGGGCFFLACQDFGTMLEQPNHSFPASAFSFLFFFEVEIWSGTLIPLFRPGSIHSSSVHSGSVHSGSDDCGRMFPNKLCVSLFPDEFPHYTWTAA